MTAPDDNTDRRWITDKVRAQLLNDPKVVANNERQAQIIADAANDLAVVKGAQYGVETRTGGTRARTYVKPMNPAAVIDDAQNQTLTKAATTRAHL